MDKILVLNEQDINRLITLDLAICADEEAYMQKSGNKGDVWPLVFHEFEHNVFDLDIRSGNLEDLNAYGFKLISYNENNPKNGLNKVNATSMIFDASTGKPMALLNAAAITSYRTGAAAAVGCKFLARKESKNLLVLGNGNIAKYSIAATLLVMDNIEVIDIYNYFGNLDKEKLDIMKESISKLIPSVDINRYKFNIVTNIENASRNADIIITTTPSEKAMIKAEWVKKGTHFSCMGTCMKNHQEIDENIFKISKIFADDEQQCLNNGEAQTAFNKNIIMKFDDEIGNIILNKNLGRTNDEDITVFDSTGLFLQDLATAIKIMEKAKQENIGTYIEL